MINKKVRWYESNKLTTEERFLRTLESDACRDLAYKKMYYYNNEMRVEEIEKLWVREPENVKTASYGSHWGFYVGLEEIKRYYIDKHADDRQKQYEDFKAAGPGYKGGLLTGVSMFRSINTPLIYIAEDGKTAQGAFFIGGQETLPRPGGKTEAFHIFARVGIDFIKEGDDWKIWHWAEVYDFVPAVGEASEDMPLIPEPEYEPFREEFVSGKPTIDMITHYPFMLSTDGWPVFPCAHKTYNLDNSYAPEAHPGIRDDVVDVNWAARASMVEAWGR